MGPLGMVRNLQGGVLVFHCVWGPLDGDGLVEAGAGGAL